PASRSDRAGARSRSNRSRNGWLKKSTLLSATACLRKKEPSFFALCFSASAAALSGSEARNSSSSRPVSWSSIQAVHFSSNVFINILQQVLQFLPRIKQSRHHSADGTTECFRDLVVLHVFGFLHQNYRPMFRRKLRDRLIDPRPHLLPLHSLVRQRLSARYGFRGRIDFSQLNIVIEFRPASFDLFFAEPIDGH